MFAYYYYYYIKLFAFSMKKTSNSNSSSTTTYIVVKLVFVLVLLYKCCCYCDGAAIKHIPAEPPSHEEERTPELRVKLERVLLSILLGGITGFLCALVCGCLLRCILRYMKRIPILKGPVVFSPEISPKALESAVANETQVVGSSPNGKYYMTQLENGLTVAVKKVESGSSPQDKRGMQRELEILGRVRHRHLMRLRAYVCESAADTTTNNRLCLVYDYVPTGSLEDAMKRVKQNELQLGWDARLHIAVGIIKGLQYLHFTLTPRMLHYNLKPSNVMLDAEFEPRLGDCGLGKVMMHRHQAAVPAPPECRSSSSSNMGGNMMSKYTEKSDIFSFGVILGILLTGRDASDATFGSDMGMWFRAVLEAGDGREALDKSLLGEEMEEDEMLMAVRIAAVCLSDMPADRPSSDELVPMLTQLHSF